MFSKVTQRASPRIFAALAICAVAYLWANFLHRLPNVSAPPFPIGLLVAASLLTLAFRAVFAGKEGKASRVIYIAWALALSAVAPVFVGETLGQISLPSIAVYATSMFSLDIARRDWGHWEARELMALTSLLFGIVVFVSSILGHTYQLPYVLVYLTSTIMSVTLARDIDVQTKVRNAGGSFSGLTAGASIGAILLLVGMLSTGMLVGFSTALASLGWWAREIFMLLLYPFGLLAHGLVLLLRYFQLNVPWLGLSLPGADELLVESPLQPSNASLLMALGVVSTIFAVLLFVAYLFLRPSRAPDEAVVREERESLLSQAFTKLNFRLPRLKRKQSGMLAADPKDVYQVFAWLEHWGKSKGRARRREETVAEYAAEMESRFFPEDVQAVSKPFEQAKYAEQSLTALQWQRVRSAWGRLKKQFEQGD